MFVRVFAKRSRRHTQALAHCRVVRIRLLSKALVRLLCRETFSYIGLLRGGVAVRQAPAEARRRRTRPQQQHPIFFFRHRPVVAEQ